MPQLVALLRAVNVGAANRITMDELRGIFASLGLESVTTYLQSGNVVFAAKSGAQDSVRREIERALTRRFRNEMTAVLRTRAQLQAVVKDSPFNKHIAEGALPYITFLDNRTPAPALGVTPRGDLEIVRARPSEIFTLGLKVKGHYGNPNAYLERVLKTKATTRNWNVVQALAKADA